MPRNYKGNQNETSAGGIGSGFQVGSMRNRSDQRRPGTPIPFGERPEGRPMAHELPGRNYEAEREARSNAYRESRIRQDALAPRSFSWEQGQRRPALVMRPGFGNWQYGDWLIEPSASYTPDSAWQFRHKDWEPHDGQTERADPRCGFAASALDCVRVIEEEHGDAGT